MSDRQRTLKEKIYISGKGLHTGKQVNITFHPAEVDHGISFQRSDLENKPTIKVIAYNVYDTSRGTSIRENGAEVKTIEHMMASIVALKIDNLLIEIDCDEVPILDGSAILYFKEFEKAGTIEQEKDKNYLIINKELNYSYKKKKVEMIAKPADHFRINVMVDYNTKVLGVQHAELNYLKNFYEEIAPCRTFAFLHELKPLIKAGLIKGGDLKNAIIYVDELLSKEDTEELSTFFNNPKIDVLEEGILNNLELRFSNEAARHKLLDVVGDLALIGRPIKGHIVAKHPGHSTNVEFAKFLLENND
jgi:UDP-3-O-[3-hydroxymyristoyl] N-acetylglucosamine deacetylase / 3-hydroxyacyl-[acyl-carrier-protein] dehydratase